MVGESLGERVSCTLGEEGRECMLSGYPVSHLDLVASSHLLLEPGRSGSMACMYVDTLTDGVFRGSGRSRTREEYGV
jgi:hypothetical protein